MLVKKKKKKKPDTEEYILYYTIYRKDLKRLKGKTTEIESRLMVVWGWDENGD